MTRAGKKDWRDEAVETEMKRLNLGNPQPGETLSQYMARHGVSAKGVIQPMPKEKKYDVPSRIPGEDDDL